MSDPERVETWLNLTLLTIELYDDNSIITKLMIILLCALFAVFTDELLMVINLLEFTSTMPTIRRAFERILDQFGANPSGRRLSMHDNHVEYPYIRHQPTDSDPEQPLIFSFAVSFVAFCTGFENGISIVM